MYLEYKGEKRYIYVCEKNYFSKSFSLPLNAQELQYAILNFAQDHKITDLQHIGVEVHCPEAYSSNPDEKLILTYHKDKNKEEIEQSVKKRVEELKKEISKRTFTIQVKVGDKGQIFGGAHEKDIVAAINQKLNTHLEKQSVQIKQPIKAIGKHEVKIKLGQGIEAITNINIEAK